MSDRKEARQLEIPSIELLEGELKRTQYNRRYRRTLRTTIFSLLLVAAAARPADLRKFHGEHPDGRRPGHLPQ